VEYFLKGSNSLREQLKDGDRMDLHDEELRPTNQEQPGEQEDTAGNLDPRSS
jgi:hypothetical protein